MSVTNCQRKGKASLTFSLPHILQRSTLSLVRLVVVFLAGDIILLALVMDYSELMLLIAMHVTE